MPNELRKLANAQALANPGDTWADVNTALREMATRQAGPQLARIGIGAAGVGTAIAGLRHLLHLKTEQDVRDSEEASRPSPVYLHTRKQSMHKRSMLSGMLDSAQGVLTGQNATRPMELPWFAPAAAATGLAAGYGGFKLTENLIDSIRAKAQAKEIERARSEYQQALTGGGAKTAGERCKLATDVDRIVNMLTYNGRKLADTPPGDTSRALSMLAGLYLTAIGGAAGYGAYQGFKNQRSGSKTRAVNRAQLERQLTRQKQIAPVVANDEEEEKVAGDKVAILDALAVGAAGGAGLSSLLAGEGNRTEGAVRGIAPGVGATTGVGIGGIGGAVTGSVLPAVLAAMLKKKLPLSKAFDAAVAQPSIPGVLLGGIAGGGALGYGGAQAGSAINHMLAGPASYAKQPSQ